MSAHRIMIVDDELDFGTTLAECPELRGFAAKAVGGAQDAMEVLAADWRGRGAP